ncbi:MAG: branched-chain amino acid transport system II carrier protein [Oscillospiraceae bacterium]|jgi:LIVCS family branched-chain amino acid:cation transporter
MHKTRRDIFVIGFALFSMFFGAGNVIFPPYLGLESGSQWFLGFACYYLADIGLALLALFATLYRGGIENITKPIGKVPATLLLSAIILCIGPMLAIPRTAASTYEMSLSPLVSNANPIFFSFLFFLVIFLLSMKESAVVDIVGKALTPMLLLGLLIMIVKGVLDPIGPIPTDTLVENVPANGIEAGYQTMDVLASLVFGIICIKSAEDKGYTKTKDKLRVVAAAGIIAGAALLVVYLGLTYLGVTTSHLFDLSVDRTALVVAIVRHLLGDYGVILFSIVVALACISTAVTLVSAAADFFSGLSGGRLSYRLLVMVICLFSAVVSNVGLEQIISIASPILEVVYPPALTLTLLAFFSNHIQNCWVFRFAVLGSLIFSLLTVASRYMNISLSFLDMLPLASLGFGWLLPAAAGCLIGSLIPCKPAVITTD